MNSISLEYPLWYILLCILLGAAYAVALYFKHRDFDDTPKIRAGLGFLRAFAVSLIALMLLNPYIKSLFEDIRQPIILVAQDVSSSINGHIGPPESYKKEMEDLIQSLESKYELRTFSVGSSTQDSIRFQFEEPETDLSSFFTKIKDGYDHLNVGGIILASDGLFNKGSDPRYLSSQIQAPTHTILLGDTTTPKDLTLKGVFHNEIAYLDDHFEVEIDISATNFTNENTQLIIEKFNGSNFVKVKSEDIKINQKNFFSTKKVTLEASDTGIKHYRIKIKPKAGESNTSNNIRDFFIEVLDTRQKVLIVKNSPHPDISAIKSSLSGNSNYECSVKTAVEATTIVHEHDLVIIHNRPNNSTALIKKCQSLKKPILHILGNIERPELINKDQDIATLKITSRNLNDVQAEFNPNFELFKIETKHAKLIQQFPPLIAPFGEYSINPKAKTLFYQKIGSVKTKYPLIGFSKNNEHKQGVIFGEGLWKWKLFNYLKTKNHESFDFLIEKIIQYLAIKENKDKFRARSSQNLYSENESIHFSAELYNNSYELINGPEVSIAVKSATGENYEYVLNRNDDGYELEVGQLPANHYSYSASTKYGGKEFIKKGQFTIKKLELEKFNTVANHNLMRALSEQQNGNSYFHNQINEIKNDLLNQSDIKPQVFYSSRSKSAIHLKWIFGIIAFLLCLEWFLRRYFGRY